MPQRGILCCEVQEVIDDLKASVDAGTQAVSGTTGLVTTATERLVTAGQALLGYLARRDEILEAERDRVLHEVLDEFARGTVRQGTARSGGARGCGPLSTAAATRATPSATGALPKGCPRSRPRSFPLICRR